MYFEFFTEEKIDRDAALRFLLVTGVLVRTGENDCL